MPTLSRDVDSFLCGTCTSATGPFVLTLSEQQRASPCELPFPRQGWRWTMIAMEWKVVLPLPLCTTAPLISIIVRNTMWGASRLFSEIIHGMSLTIVKNSVPQYLTFVDPEVEKSARLGFELI